jgi:ketosteroid isomerase-like protein
MVRVAWLLLLTLIAVPAAVTLAHPPSILSEREEKATAEEVKDFRKTVARAVEKKDARALRRIYADGFMHIHANGQVDGKDARIAAVLAGEAVIENAPVKDLVIRVPGGWTAIATGVSPLRAAADGSMHEVRWMTAYVRMGDSWQVVASHATPLQHRR